jgi:ribose-phosphate pyrophosphokinase
MLFTFPKYSQFVSAFEGIAGLGLHPFSMARYGNQEMHAAIPGNLADEGCFILGSIAPPDEQLISFTLLSHTLREHGAGQITAILPYLAYARQDKIKDGESLGAAWAGSLLKASGVDRIVTVDLHSERDEQLLEIPLISLSPANLFAQEIHSRGLTGATIVAPDHGAVRRCQAVRAAAGLPLAETPYFEKTRTDHGVVHSGLVGTTCSRVILVDDMLDTGGTLISACDKLVSMGVDEIYVFVTHGLFTGEGWQRLWSLNVKHISCTNTVPPSAATLADNDISVLSMAPALREALTRLVTVVPPCAVV